ncbi:MAG: hypothetical protein HYS13_01700 [Planctomycetia bacterium]|nr:hypothetical protein [Planctomycetia bacterium]
MHRCILAAAVFLTVNSFGVAAEPLRIATFQADVTPPLGAPLCDALVKPAAEIVDPLSARGVVLFGAGKPIVLCAVDWVGIGNGGHDAFREALAKSAETTPDRVAVHCLHQHDAPGCDFDAEALLAANGLSGKLFHVAFARQAIERVAAAAAESVKSPRNVTHVGAGRGRVNEVAATRRVMGDDGKVKYVRYSSCKDEKIRAEPEGTIDPYVHLLAFYDGDKPLAVLTYYATHPQSYYGQGGVSCDFPGLARGLREEELGAKKPGGPLLVHFNGAGGNVTAGKYNDGSKENRPVLARRLADGMKAAWESQKRAAVSAAEVTWTTRGVRLPVSERLKDEDALLKVVQDSTAAERDRLRAARDLTFARRCQNGPEIVIGCLRVGPAQVVHMPGELFVEYQLAAQQMKPGAFVAMAAYGDYGAGYIGTEISYTQGGYETGPVSRVSPAVEKVLMEAVRELLK